MQQKFDTYIDLKSNLFVGICEKNVREKKRRKENRREEKR